MADRKGPPEKAETRTNKRDFTLQSSSPSMVETGLSHCNDSADRTPLLWGKLAQRSVSKLSLMDTLSISDCLHSGLV